MTTQERDADAGQGSKRILMSMLFALLLHGIAFIMVQWVLPLKAEEVPDFSGPLYVTFEDFEPEPIAAPAKAEAVIETAAPDDIQEQEVAPKEEPRTFIEAPVKIDSGKAQRTTLPEAFRSLKQPPTTQRVIEETPFAGISTIETPEVEHETVPFGIDAPETEEIVESEPVIPPRFLKTSEEEQPLLLNMKKLDDAFQVEEEEQVIAGAGTETAESAATGDVKCFLSSCLYVHCTSPLSLLRA